MHPRIGYLCSYGGALESGCFASVVNGTVIQVGVRACGDAPGAYRCDAGEVCLRSGSLPAGTTLLTPFDGVYGFDNAGIGLYTVITAIFLEGWSPILFALNDAGGAAYNWLFFVLLIGFGTFVLLNLFTGILAVEYAKRKEQGVREEARARIEEFGETGNRLVASTQTGTAVGIDDRGASAQPKRFRRRDSTTYGDQPRLAGGSARPYDMPRAPDVSELKYDSLHALTSGLCVLLLRPPKPHSNANLLEGTTRSGLHRLSNRGRSWHSLPSPSL